MPWYRSSAALLIVSLLLPPIGLLLLWTRRGPGAGWKLLGSLPIAALTFFYLLRLGLHVELDGSGIRPLFSFYNRQERDAALERSRAEHRREPPAPPAEAPENPPLPPPDNRAAKKTAPSVLPPKASLRPRSAYWTGFRGPRRDGIYDETEILTNWPPEGLPLLWKQPIGGGYASFSIAGGMAFTIEQRRDREVAAAYHLDTGREAWTDSWEAHFDESMGGEGPRATPTWGEGRLYALGGAGEFRCLDAKTGKRIWSRNILADNGASNLYWGMAASPLIIEEKVIVLPGGAPNKSVVAYNKRTGEQIWKALDDQQAYSSPMLVTLAGQRQILLVSARRAMGLAVEDGSLLWDYPWVTEHDINVAQPIVIGDNSVFFSSGYGHGAALVAVTKTDSGFVARTVWANTRMKNKFTSSVLYQGHIYGLDEAILACIDAETGDLKWKGGRYGYGQLILASGHLIVLTESGDLVLVKATPEHHEELARFPAIQGKTWNHPAIAGGKLLVRNATEMACFRISRQ